MTRYSLRLCSNGRLVKPSDARSMLLAFLIRLDGSLVVLTIVSVYYDLVYVHLEVVADSVVLFCSYDSEFVEGVEHQAVTRECLMDRLCVVRASEYVLKVIHRLL